MLNEQKIKNINERIKGNKSSVPNSLFRELLKLNYRIALSNDQKKIRTWI